MHHYSSHEFIEIENWRTDGYDSEIRLQQRANLAFRRGISHNPLRIEIDSNKAYQSIVGYGASLTDSSAWLLREFLNETAYEDVLHALFDPNDGIGLSFVRIPFGASDCSLSWYTFDDVGPDLSAFSIDHDLEYIIPTIQDILALNPDVTLMASPFSAPGWMKLDNNLEDPATKGLIGGYLNPDYYDLYADYLIMALEAYASHGAEISLLTLQNEPFYSPPDYPGMLMNVSAQIDFLSVLGPKLAATELDTELVILDHNWDLADKALEVLADEMVRPYISGVAWHGYSSPPDPSMQSLVAEQYPSVDHYFTEVTGFGAAPHFHDNLAWLYQNVFIGSTRHWSRGALLWNFALNSSGGPILRDYYDMRGVVTVDEITQEVEYEVEYYALGQISKYVRPRAVRVHSTTHQNRFESAAFQNLDGTLVVVLCNPTNELQRATISWNGYYVEISLNAKSVITLRWNPQEITPYEFKI